MDSERRFSILSVHRQVGSKLVLFKDRASIHKFLRIKPAAMFFNISNTVTRSDYDGATYDF